MLERIRQKSLDLLSFLRRDSSSDWQRGASTTFLKDVFVDSIDSSLGPLSPILHFPCLPMGAFHPFRRTLSLNCFRPESHSRLSMLWVNKQPFECCRRGLCQNVLYCTYSSTSVVSVLLEENTVKILAVLSHLGFVRFWFPDKKLEIKKSGERGS